MSYTSLALPPSSTNSSSSSSTSLTQPRVDLAVPSAVQWQPQPDAHTFLRANHCCMCWKCPPWPHLAQTLTAPRTASSHTTQRCAQSLQSWHHRSVDRPGEVVFVGDRDVAAPVPGKKLTCAWVRTVLLFAEVAEVAETAALARLEEELLGVTELLRGISCCVCTSLSQK